jgi:hypothetical protein
VEKGIGKKRETTNAKRKRGIGEIGYREATANR